MDFVFAAIPFVDGPCLVTPVLADLHRRIPKVFALVRPQRGPGYRFAVVRSAFEAGLHAPALFLELFGGSERGRGLQARRVPVPRAAVLVCRPAGLIAVVPATFL